MISSTELVANPEREQREQNALAKVKSWVVDSDETYTALDSYLVDILALKKLIIADFSKSKEKATIAKRAATAALAAIVDQEAGHLNVIEDARRLGKQKLSDYEEVKKAELARLQAIEDARVRKEAEDRALELAALAEKGGDTEKAEAILAEPAKPAPRLSLSVPQRSTVVSTRWGATVTDPQFVLKAIEAAGKVLAKSKTKDAQDAAELLRQAHQDAQYLTYNLVALNQLATATKGSLKFGGVAFTSRKI